MNKEKEKPSILIVDDEKNTRDGLERALKNTYSVYAAEDAERGLRILGESSIDVLLTDVRMPGMDGLTLLRRALGRNPSLVCILLTAYGNVETAVEAMKLGAYDFLMKPVNLDHLDIILKRALRSRDVESENVNLKVQLDAKYDMENIVGNSGPMQEVFDVIRQVAPTEANVLIQGESGTGKELVAHALHRLSTRSRGPFIAVHCAALTPSLLESELFGHEKGSFTGAAIQRKGRFELADGGTLFLDEISETDAMVQVKLLRILEEREFERVGGSEKISVDIRLITATNKDLHVLVKQGKFREDLFFRLDVITIKLPSLRDRVDDIPLLCGHFIDEFSGKNKKKIDGITPEAVNMLSTYSWPGNVRELRNTIEKMVVMTRGGKLTARDIPLNIRDASRGSNMKQDLQAEVMNNGCSIAGAERTLIAAALKKHDGNRTKAAGELGISRRTLHRKLREYGEEGNEVQGKNPE